MVLPGLPNTCNHQHHAPAHNASSQVKNLMAKTISFGNWSLLELGCSGLPSGIRKHLRRMRVPRLLITIIHHNLGPFLDDGALIHVLLNRIGNMVY